MASIDVGSRSSPSAAVGLPKALRATTSFKSVPTRAGMVRLVKATPGKPRVFGKTVPYPVTKTVRVPTKMGAAISYKLPSAPPTPATGSETVVMQRVPAGSAEREVVTVPATKPTPRVSGTAVSYGASIPSPSVAPAVTQIPMQTPTWSPVPLPGTPSPSPTPTDPAAVVDRIPKPLLIGGAVAAGLLLWAVLK